MLTTTDLTLSMRILPRSSKPSSQTPLAMPTPSVLLSTPLRIMVTTTWFLMISTATSRLRHWLMRHTRIKTSGLPSAFKVCQEWVSSAVIDASTSMLKASGILSQWYQRRMIHLDSRRVSYKLSLHVREDSMVFGYQGLLLGKIGRGSRGNGFMTL